MFGWLKRLFGGGKPRIQAYDYAEARKILEASGSDDQTIILLNPLIWLLGAREKQKGSPLTKAEVVAIRNAAKCVIMPKANAKAFQAHMDASAPVPRIDPERVWQEWQKISPEIDRYLPG